MMDIFNMLGGTGHAEQQVSQQLGLDPSQTAAALEAAVPLLLGAVTRNAQTPEGAAALDSALDQHTGDALGLFGQGQMPNLQEGQKILGHVFGNQQQAAANAIGQRAGIDPQLAMQILMIVAPLVLNYLARQRGQAGGQTGGLGGGLGGILGSILGSGLGGSLGGMLGGAGGQTGQAGGNWNGGGNLGGNMGGSVLPGYPSAGQQNFPTAPATSAPGMGGMLGTLNSVLDRDGDGNALDDLIGMFGGRR